MILAVLEHSPAHGYAVIEAVRVRTDGAVALTTGSVHPALRRLEEAGYVTGNWSTEGGRRRRTYQLTATGRRRLRTELVLESRSGLLDAAADLQDAGWSDHQAEQQAIAVRAGKAGIGTTDGPYAETKEQLGGFWVIKADHLDTALACA